MTPSSSDLAILRWLACRTSASASQLCAAFRASPGEVRPRLAAMESHRLIASRQEADVGRTALMRVFYVTSEGRRRAGTSDARLSG